jgi:hypothetical protein
MADLELRRWRTPGGELTGQPVGDVLSIRRPPLQYPGCGKVPHPYIFEVWTNTNSWRGWVNGAWHWMEDWNNQVSIDDGAPL